MADPEPLVPFQEMECGCVCLQQTLEGKHVIVRRCGDTHRPGGVCFVFHTFKKLPYRDVPDYEAHNLVLELDRATEDGKRLYQIRQLLKEGE
jgi:hypothetical protein